MWPTRISDISVSYPGYQTATVQALIVGTEPGVGVLLKPARPAGRVSFTGRLCSSSPPTIWGTVCAGQNYPYPLEATHVIAGFGPGIANLDVRFQYVGDYYTNHLDVEVLCQGDLIAAKAIAMSWDGVPWFEPGHVAGPIAVNLPRRCDYRINYISNRKGGDSTTYRVDVDPQ